eukprot:5596712-Alexandrium_andersonii.AAC.1
MAMAGGCGGGAAASVSARSAAPLCPSSELRGAPPPWFQGPERAISLFRRVLPASLRWWRSGPRPTGKSELREIVAGATRGI